MKKKKNNDRCKNLNSTCFNEHITVIENNTNLTLCLVCKESLADDDPNYVSTHLLGSSHNENLKIMFKMCIPDDHCGSNDNNRAKIISNSVFDVSILLKNETSYIHRYENRIVCLICQDIISEIKHCNEAVKNDVFSHLQSEQHLTNIKRNVCWVYQLETVSGFLMFHKTFIFCSICDKIIQTDENCTLKSAVTHLLIEHPKELNSFDEPLSHKIDDVKETQQEVFGNSKVKRNVRKNALNYIHFEHQTNRLDKCNLSKLKENEGSKNKKKIQSSTKMEIAQRNDVNPFIITIQCSKTFTFCAVCKDIATDISGSRIYNGVPSHLWSPRHRERIEPIIYQCIPDPFCDKSTEKYNELASVLNSETGCIFQGKNYVTCLICKNPITNITQSFETIQYDLAYHFGSKQHLNLMRENVWWFYYLQFGEVFIAFVNHISHCTKCTSNLESIPYRVVQCVKEHLQAEDLMLLDRMEGNTPYCSELMCYECNKAVEIYNNDPELSINLHREKHRDLSEVNNHRAIEVSNDAEYTCPICLEKILIFNKDIELSVYLHGCNDIEKEPNRISNAIGYDASTVFNNLPGTFIVHRDFISFDGEEFFCKLCNCTFLLPSSFKDACRNVQTHITESYHKEQYNTCTMISTQPVGKTDNTIDLWDKFNDEHDPNTLSLMYSVIDENNQYIGKCESYYFCKICKCCFIYFGNKHEIMKIFASHFMCKNHKKKLKRYVSGECSVNYVGDKYTSDESNEPSSLQPATVETNCNKYIFDKLKCLPGFQLNSQFLVVQGDTVFCTLCKISIPCDKTNKVRKHCYSESHSMILVETAAAYITNHENKQFVNVADPCNEKFVNVLKKLAESYYRINNPTITSNLLYIDNNGKNFVCLVCNLNIKFSVDGSTLVRHFMAALHKQKILNLNCNNPSNNVEEIPKGEQLQSLLPSGGNESVTCYDKENPSRERDIENIGVEVSYFFEKLPKEYSIYRDFISMDGKNMTCLLCSFTLLFKKNFEADCKILKEHMTSRFHKEQYLVYTSNGMSNGSDQNMNKDPWERFDDKSNTETHLEVQQVNDENKEYFEKGKIYFMCCLCDAYFLYFDEEDMKNTFASHCSTTDHVKNLKWKSNKFKRRNHLKADKNVKCLTMELDAQSISRHSDGCDLINKVDSGLKRSRSSFVIKLNQNFLKAKENQLFCDVCQVFIKVSENESYMRGHCYSQAHNMILTKYSISYVEGLGKNNTIDKTNKFRLMCENVLKKMAKSSYIERNNTVIANLFFISYNTRQFFCHLCDRNIRFAGNGSSVMGHIISKLHVKNLLKLNCIYRSQISNENTPDKEVKDIATDDNSELNIPTGDLMSPIIYHESTLENVEMNCGELSVTLETQQHSLEIGDKLFKIPEGHTKSCKEIVTTSPLNTYISTYSSFNDEFEFSSQSARNFEVLGQSFNYSFLYQTRINCDDSGNNTGMYHDKPLIVEMKSAHELASFNNKFIREIFDCFPDSYHKYMEHITMQIDTLVCSLCKSLIETERRDFFESAVELYFHLSSKFHEEHETLQSAQEDLNQLKSELQPDTPVHIFKNINSPEKEKLIFWNSNKLPFEIQNTKESLDEQEKHEQTTFEYTKVLTYEGSSTNEVTLFEDELDGSETQFSRESHNSQNVIECSPNEKDCKSSTPDQGEKTPQDKFSDSVSYVLSDFLKNINENLMVHQEFLSLNENRVMCKLCVVTLNTDDVKSHLTGLTHKCGFFAELKRRVGNDVKSEVKLLMFLNYQLYCGVCQCYITPWSNFDSICQGVSSHLKLPAHRKSDLAQSIYLSNLGNQERADLSTGAEKYSQKAENELNVSINSQCKSKDEDDIINPTVKHNQSKATDQKYSSSTLSSLSENVKRKCAISNSIFKKLKDSVHSLEESREFITFHHNNYYCCLCNKGITHSSNFDILANNFNVHLTSKAHLHFLRNLKSSWM